MHVSLNNKGVTTSSEAVFLAPFFYQYMTGIYHLLIDAIQELRSKQAQVVFERLHLVFGLVGPVTVAQHLAQRVMMIRQFVDPIKVRIQSKPQYAKDQDAPLLHPRATAAGIRFAFTLNTIRKNFSQYGEDPIAKPRLGVNVLQSPQKLRNVVTRLTFRRWRSQYGANFPGLCERTERVERDAQ